MEFEDLYHILHYYDTHDCIATRKFTVWGYNCMRGTLCASNHLHHMPNTIFDFNIGLIMARKHSPAPITACPLGLEAADDGKRVPLAVLLGTGTMGRLCFVWVCCGVLLTRRIGTASIGRETDQIPADGRNPGRRDLGREGLNTELQMCSEALSEIKLHMHMQMER